MSKLVTHLRRFAVALVGAAIITPASAAVLFTIQRIDDTHARLIANGTLGATSPDFNTHLLALTNPFATDPVTDTSVPVASHSNLHVGAFRVSMAHAASPQFDLFGDQTSSLYLWHNGYGSFAPGAEVQGYFNLELTSGATFAAAGSSGLVNWGVLDFANPQHAGEWVIVDAPVPEPGSLALGGIALAGLMLARRRRA